MCCVELGQCRHEDRCKFGSFPLTDRSAASCLPPAVDSHPDAFSNVPDGLRTGRGTDHPSKILRNSRFSTSPTSIPPRVFKGLTGPTPIIHRLYRVPDGLTGLSPGKVVCPPPRPPPRPPPVGLWPCQWQYMSCRRIDSGRDITLKW
jgi:hypothetical protein